LCLEPFKLAVGVKKDEAALLEERQQVDRRQPHEWQVDAIYEGVSRQRLPDVI